MPIRWPWRWRCRRPRRSRPQRAATDALGRAGERAAVRALRREGYRVLARRRRFGGAEVDVLALEGETLVLVEVKSTASPTGRPARRVDARKVRRLRAGWRALARDPALARRPCRLDVVEVRLPGGPARCRILRGHGALSDRGG